MSRRTVLKGWGRTAPTVAHVTHPRSAGQVAEALAQAGPRGVLARGMGRSYGDAAQAAGGLVLDCTELTGRPRLDTERQEVTAPAGTSLERIIAHLLRRGHFVSVTPGTSHVTLGGAIAADVHGKNHHADSSIGAHVRSLTLITPDGRTRRLGPDHGDTELFWATVGGMGLTGVITEATLGVYPVESAYARVDTDRTRDLDSTLELMARTDHAYRYTVCWVDLLAKGSSLGRGVLTRAHHARLGDLPAPIPLDITPELPKRHNFDRFSIRVEGLLSGARLSQGMNNGDRTWSLTLDDLETIKQKQQVTWASGDYAVIGTTLQIVGESLCGAVDVAAGGAGPRGERRRQED